MKTVEPGALLTREQICKLPFEDRLPYVEQIRVFYPRWQEVIAEIRRCHQMNTVAAEPQCLMLVGPTGAGKTTLIESYTKQYPPIKTETGVIIPVVQATIPPPATVKNLAATLLQVLGDPLSAKGTTGGMTYRLVNFLRDCCVEMLILDELQHFVDRDSQKVLQNVSNWLKTLIKETKIACVLVGLEGEAEQVVDTNPQLARLFGDPYVLSPFQWDEARPSTIQEFRTFLVQLDQLLPLQENSNLANRDTAWRCFAASKGVTSYVMALIRRATYLALTQRRERLDNELLALAFSQRLAGRRRNIANPFTGNSPLLETIEEPASDRPALNAARRSKARGKRRDQIKDFL